MSKKTPIPPGFGHVIHDNEVFMNDADDVNSRHLRRLHCKYVDAYGAGSNFTVTFAETYSFNQ